MVSPKLQAPGSKEAPNPKLQMAAVLEFGAWNLFEAWSLELGTS
jgi:hypothetical protein